MVYDRLEEHDSPRKLELQRHELRAAAAPCNLQQQKHKTAAGAAAATAMVAEAAAATAPIRLPPDSFRTRQRRFSLTVIRRASQDLC